MMLMNIFSVEGISLPPASACRESVRGVNREVQNGKLEPAPQPLIVSVAKGADPGITPLKEEARPTSA